MLIIDVNDQKAVEDHVAALGAVPAANYLVMYKRVPGWMAVVGALNSRDPSQLDRQMAANEQLYLVIFDPGRLIIQNIEHGAKNNPQVLLVGDFKDLGSDELQDQILMHFTIGKKRVNYYQFKAQKMPRYQTDNWSHLRSTHFNNLSSGHEQKAVGATRQITVTTHASAPERRQDVVTATGSAANRLVNQQAKPLPVVSGDDIPASARPEREYHGLFGGGRKKIRAGVHPGREEHRSDMPSAEWTESWLRRRVNSVPKWRLVLYVGALLFLAGSYTVENIGHHVITGTVTAKRLVEHARSGDDRYVELRMANGKTMLIENNNALFHHKMSADKLQAKLKKGVRYRFETVGLMNNDWVSYNIVKATAVK